MNRPPLDAFLDAAISNPDAGGNLRDPVGHKAEALMDVLAAIVATYGVTHVAEQTGLDRDLLRATRDGSVMDEHKPGERITLGTAAELLAVASTFSPTEVRARIRDHLILSMSRGPTDAESLASRYGFDDVHTVRDKIEGDRSLTLREYARLGVALDR